MRIKIAELGCAYCGTKISFWHVRPLATLVDVCATIKGLPVATWHKVQCFYCGASTSWGMPYTNSKIIEVPETPGLLVMLQNVKDAGIDDTRVSLWGDTLRWVTTVTTTSTGIYGA